MADKPREAWFSPKRRDLVASGLIRSFSLAFGAFLLSDIIWKGPLKVKFMMGIMLSGILVMAVIICNKTDPATKEKEGGE